MLYSQADKWCNDMNWRRTDEMTRWWRQGEWKMVYINSWLRELKESECVIINREHWRHHVPEVHLVLRRLVKNGEEQQEQSRGGRISGATWERSSLCTTLLGLRKHNTGLMCSSYSECQKIIHTCVPRVSAISSASIRQPSVLAELCRWIIHFQCGQCASACLNPTLFVKCTCQPLCKVSCISSRVHTSRCNICFS